MVSEPTLVRGILRDIIYKGDLNLKFGGYAQNMLTMDSNAMWKVI